MNTNRNPLNDDISITKIASRINQQLLQTGTKLGQTDYFKIWHRFGARTRYVVAYRTIWQRGWGSKAQRGRWFSWISHWSTSDQKYSLRTYRRQAVSHIAWRIRAPKLSNSSITSYGSQKYYDSSDWYGQENLQAKVLSGNEKRDKQITEQKGMIQYDHRIKAYNFNPKSKPVINCDSALQIWKVKSKTQN